MTLADAGDPANPLHRPATDRSRERMLQRTTLTIGLCLLLTVPSLAGAAATADPDDTSQIGKAAAETKIPSEHLGGDVLVPPGVFQPMEAELVVLPFMKENAA